jgi:hypothetical protein
VAAEGRAGRDALTNLAEPLALRLLLERDNLAAAIEPEDAHRRRLFDRNRLRGDRDVGAAVAVDIDHFRIIHSVQMIAGEDEVEVRVVADEMACRLADGVSGALIPVRVVRGLFGGEDLDEPLAERIHPKGMRDMPIERRRVELRQHEDATNVGVEAVADRDVDQSIAAADRHGRFRALQRQRIQPRPLAAAKNDREHVVVHRHMVTRRGSKGHAVV